MSKQSAYLPFQPGFENNDYFKKYTVPTNNKLYKVVTDFYQFNLSNAQMGSSVDILPDGCTDLFFQISTYDTADIQISINGTTKSLISVSLDEKYVFFGIRFYPGAIKRLFNLPGEDFIESNIPVIDFLTEEQYEDMVSIVTTSLSFEERIDRICEYLLSLIEDTSPIPMIVSYSVDYIIKYSGNVKVNALADSTGYSSRYLRKNFTDVLGLSPKEFCEIVRFQKSFGEYNSEQVSLSNLAAKYGYSDHSQMDKAYIKIASHSPTRLKQYFYSSEMHKQMA